jgi:hypothetical protein
VKQKHFVNTVDTPYDDEVEQQQPGNLDRITSKNRNPQNHIRFDHPQAVVFRQGASTAEETINNANTGSKPNQGGEVYPTDPRSGRMSDFPLGLRGCMSCGNKNHRFSECKSRSEVTAREKFYANFNAHREHITNARLMKPRRQTLLVATLLRHPGMACIADPAARIAPSRSLSKSKQLAGTLRCWRGTPYPAHSTTITSR